MDSLATFSRFTQVNHLEHPTMEDGFEGEQFILLSQSDRLRCAAHPVASQLHPLTFGYYPSAPGHRVHRKEGKRGWSFHYCLSGKGTFELEGKTFAIGSGSAFVIPSGTEHTYETDHKHPWSYFWVRFEGHLAEQYIALLGATIDSPVLYMPEAQRLFQIYQQLYAARRMYYNELDLVELSHLLGLLLMQAARTIKPLSSRQLSSNDQIRKSIRFMEKNPHHNCSLEDLISIAGMSARNYSRQFRALTGVAPINYFVQMKINDAGHKLKYTELPIDQIAQSLGYTDPLYFSRAFRKSQGVAPSAYRKELRD